MKQKLDHIDLKILNILLENGRTPISELAQMIDLSAPSIADRIRRLEERQIISNFTLTINKKNLDFTIEAIVRIKPRPGHLHRVEQMIIDEARFIDCDKVTGDDCFVARLILKSIDELDDLLDPFHERAETNTSIIKSSPFRSRTLYLEQEK